MIFSILKSLALGVWLGALIMLGYAVAGPIFQHSPSKTVAGTINGIILGRMNTIEWVCWTVALVSSILLLVLHWSGARGLRVAELTLIVVAGALLWIYSIRITARMETLRTMIGDFDHPRADTEYVAAKTEFDSLHHTYTAIVSTNMILVLGAFTLSIITVKQ